MTTPRCSTCVFFSETRFQGRLYQNCHAGHNPDLPALVLDREVHAGFGCDAHIPRRAQALSARERPVVPSTGELAPVLASVLYRVYCRRQGISSPVSGGTPSAWLELATELLHEDLDTFMGMCASVVLRQVPPIVLESIRNSNPLAFAEVLSQRLLPPGLEGLGTHE
jgi:hypothetical protein